MIYQEFLKSKQVKPKRHGITSDFKVHPLLFDFQQALVNWSVRKGRSALFTACGTGKTLMQLEWARILDVNTLILAPLAVAQQTITEGLKLDIEVKYARNQSQVDGKITITNYEMLDHFDADLFEAVILDES